MPNLVPNLVQTLAVAWFDAIPDAILIVAAVVYLIASSLLFVFGINMMMLAITVWRSGKPSLTPVGPQNLIDGDLDLPMVTVQLPIYNELYVAARVIDAASSLDYPTDRLQIQVLDDSTDETSLVIATAVQAARERGLTVDHVQRENRHGYKAGALQAGLQTATGELVAIFDADFSPPADFLTRSVGHFAQPDLAFVQARWGHLNRGYSWITRLQALAIDGHFMVEQAARGYRGYWFNFNGTAGVWRVSAIEDAGGWTHETLTEDLDLSYRAHLRGWRGEYLVDLEAPGEVPAQMSSFRRQQHRWARGSLECAHKLLGSVWRSDASFATKFQATTHLCAYGIHLLLTTLAIIYPLVVLASARFPGFSTLYGASYILAISSTAPALFFVTGQRQLHDRWWKEAPRMLIVTLLGSGLMLNTVRAATQIFTRPNPEFERTAKFGISIAEPVGKSWTHKRYQLDLDRIVFAEAALGLYCLFSAWLAATERNWGVFIYATIFGLGLLSVSGITIGQSIAVHRGRRARATQLQNERSELGRPSRQTEGAA